MKSIQDRVLNAWPKFEVETLKDLLEALRKQLLKEHEAERLKTPLEGIRTWVRINMEPEADQEILGGIKDFRRDPASARLVRDDGAWIHFTIRVRQEDRKTLSLVAYAFEIVFPVGHTPGWTRLDLNPPDHPNAAREIRSHLHPGNDDMLLPAPVMTPHEILDYLIHQLRRRDPEKPRA